MTWQLNTSCGKETSKIRYEAWQYIHGVGVDVGCGDDLVHPDAIGIDRWRNGSFPVAKLARDGQDISCFKELDYVYSSHFLEHCVDYKKVLANWWDAIKPGGYLILYLPHKAYYPNVGQFGANPDHKHDFHPQDILGAMSDVATNSKTGFIVLEDEDRYAGNEYSFYQVYMKTDRPEDRIYTPWQQRKPKKSCLIIRYGAFGDMVMMLSLVEPLLADGYTIHLNTNKRGANIVKHDHRFQHIIINDVEGPITGGFLEPYWNHFKTKYDKVIQLTATIEDSLLLTPYNPHLYNLTHEQRHKLCNHNYREWTHASAGVPIGAPPTVALAPDEVASAVERIAPYAGKTVALVVVRGSAHHKQYTYLAPFLHRLVTTKNMVALLAADDGAKDYVSDIISAAERYGVPQGSIVSTIGDDIRATMALAHVVDIVIGPETGVLNAVAYLPIVKAMWLSHSSTENLSKDWVNVLSIRPDPEVKCYPCHRLHYGTAACNVDKQGAALCTKHDPIKLADAIMFEYDRIKAEKNEPQTVSSN